MDDDEFEDLDELQFVQIVDGCFAKGHRIVLVTGRHLVIYPEMNYERLRRQAGLHSNPWLNPPPPPPGARPPISTPYSLSLALHSHP